MTQLVPSDQNLLFGIVALQRGYVRERDLIASMHAWALVPEQTLRSLLVERAALTEAQAREIDSILGRRHLPSARPVPAEPDAKPQRPVAVDAPTPAALPEPRPSPSLSNTPSPHDLSALAPSRFRIVRAFRKGGLGEVFVARDEELGREVALKQIQDRWADDPTSRQRFLLEARITGGLEHPGIVPVHGLGWHADGRPFYAMRLVQGENLREAIVRYHHALPERRPRLLRDLLCRFVDVCNTIAYAHSKGVIHRDLKPANIMVGPYGETLVVDWGLARVMESADAFPVPAGTDTQLSIPGMPIGSPSYMSPEQATGRVQEIDTRTDIYLLGGVLFEILTGRPPHADVKAGLPAPAPRSLVPDIPEALDLIATQALQPRRELRHQSAAELADDVDRWLAGLSLTPGAKIDLGDIGADTAPPTVAAIPTPSPAIPSGYGSLGETPHSCSKPDDDTDDFIHRADEVVDATDMGSNVLCWSEPQPPDRFGDLQELTRGDSTILRLCHDENLNRLVVIKEVRPELLHDPVPLAALYREAQITAQLDHPHIRAIHGIGRHPDSRPFLVLRYVRGRDLHQVVRDFHDQTPNLSARDATLRSLLAAFAAVCRAVAYANARGVMHGSVRASNVVIGPEGEPSLIDWGEAQFLPDYGKRGERVELAEWFDPPVSLERPGSSSGDTFALGAMLYHILVGWPPHSPLARVRDRASWVPAKLASLCARAMARDLGSHRLAASELADAVTDFLISDVRL